MSEVLLYFGSWIYSSCENGLRGGRWPVLLRLTSVVMILIGLVMGMEGFGLDFNPGSLAYNSKK